jgi:hypothetical protein
VKNASKSVCTSFLVISVDPLSPIPSTSTVKILDNTEEDPDDPELADAGDIYTECSLISRMTQVYEQ